MKKVKKVSYSGRVMVKKNYTAPTSSEPYFYFEPKVRKKALNRFLWVRNTNCPHAVQGSGLRLQHYSAARSPDKLPMQFLLFECATKYFSARQQIYEKPVREKNVVWMNHCVYVAKKK